MNGFALYNQGAQMPIENRPDYQQGKLALQQYDRSLQQLAAGHNQAIDSVLKAILDFYMCERKLIFRSLYLIVQYSSPQLKQEEGKLHALVRIREKLLQR